MKNTIVADGSEGSILKPTKEASNSERDAIIAAFDSKIGRKESLTPTQNFATSGRAIFRLDSPRNKPTFEIQRNGDKAPGEQTTVACVCIISGFQELLNVTPDFADLQPSYNELLWSKLKSSFVKTKNMNVTVNDLKPILNRMEYYFK